VAVAIDMETTEVVLGLDPKAEIVAAVVAVIGLFVDVAAAVGY